MQIKLNIEKMTVVRSIVQWSFFVWILIIGIQFGFFVRHFAMKGESFFVNRPAGVEGFLPIGALASLKHWLYTGQVDRIHPAALVLFLTFLAMSLLAKKSFCSWLCPVGTVSEGLWKFGKWLFGRSFHMWGWLDFLLRGGKYLLLLFFVKILVLDMPVYALEQFLQTPYWAISDVKMLYFFTNMSLTTIFVLLLLAGFSLFYKNFWCRYLCPYGALLGLISFFSPLKIRRNVLTCTDCGLCSRACPSRLNVHRLKTVSSPECSGCLSCVDACPTAAVQMKLSLWSASLPRWTFPVVVLVVYAGGVTLGMVTGHWDSSLGYEDYQRLIPMTNFLSH